MASNCKGKNSRITVNVEDDLFDAIEDFRFENRFQSRSDAIIALLKMGIEELKKGEVDIDGNILREQEKV